MLWLGGVLDCQQEPQKKTMTKMTIRNSEMALFFTSADYARVVAVGRPLLLDLQPLACQLLFKRHGTGKPDEAALGLAVQHAVDGILSFLRLCGQCRGALLCLDGLRPSNKHSRDQDDDDVEDEDDDDDDDVDEDAEGATEAAASETAGTPSEQRVAWKAEWRALIKSKRRCLVDQIAVCVCRSAASVPCPLYVTR
jgi:hypothetical protein